MKFFIIRNSTATITWLVFLQLSNEFAESIPSRTTEIDRKRHSSGIVNIRVTRNDKILTLQNHRQKDNVKDSITTTNESFMPTINDFSQLNETFIDTTGLPITEEEKIPFNLAAFNKVEQLAFPLNVDISSLPISHSVGTPLFPNFLGESEFKSKTGDSTTHQIEDSLIDPKRKETEPFFSILVNNSPPQVVTESSKPPSSSISPSDLGLVNIPLSYLDLRVPIASSVSKITLAPLPLIPLNPDNPFPSSGTFPENVEISSSVKAMNHLSAIDKNMSNFSNLTVFPFPPALVTIDFKSHSGQQVSSYNSDRQYFYRIPPSLLGIGIIYPAASPTWVSPHYFSTQFQFDQSKFNLATSYGSSPATHPLYRYGNSHRQKFGSPPTPRTLGFPPISNTRDNMRLVVNWARVGRAYQPKNIS